MSMFKDFIQQEAEAFINIAEFAEEVNIDGIIFMVVIDSDLLKKYNLRNQGEGLTQGELLFHAKKADFEEELYVDRRLRFNNRLYKISDIQDDLGIYTITLVGMDS